LISFITKGEKAVVRVSKIATKADDLADAAKLADTTGDAAKAAGKTADAVQGAASGRKYVPNPKHDTPGRDISPNPFGNNTTAGQKSLETAYSSSGNKQLYNVHDGKLVKFQPDNAGGFHPYEVINPAAEVPTDVLRQMKNDGLISNAQYNKWIKNK
ncbi:hypothetical protein, partial [Acetonema longum]